MFLRANFEYIPRHNFFLFLTLKNAEIATSAVFCKNAWIWLVSLFYFASELKKVQLTGAEHFLGCKDENFNAHAQNLFRSQILLFAPKKVVVEFALNRHFPN